MSKCGNCGATLSCGCQKRVTADGKQACTKCIHKVAGPPKNTNVSK